MTINYIFDGKEFEFEVDNEKFEDFLKSKSKSELLEIIFDVIDKDELFDCFVDEISEYYEDEAERKFEAENDPLGSVGMSQRDFI